MSRNHDSTNPEAQGRDRTVRDRARLTLASQVQRADAILALPGLGDLGDAATLAALLFRGAVLEGDVGDGTLPWTRGDALADLLGQIGCALYRYGNVRVVVRPDGRVELVAPGRDSSGPERVAVDLARFERATEGVGASVMSRGFATFEKLRRTRDSGPTSWGALQRRHLEAQLVQEVGYQRVEEGQAPTLDPAVGLLLAWETVTLVRDHLLAALLPAGRPVPELRVPRLQEGRIGR